MNYNKIKFSFGSPVEDGYMITSESGEFLRFTDLDGNTLVLESCGYVCVDPNPRPNWAT
jgi:hypothetical protein